MSFPLIETRQLNDKVRQFLEGSFLQLRNGFTHYELANGAPLPEDKGAEARETVVFVHGFSVPYFIFDPTFEFLSRSGFRSLRYDLFGRGFSDRPRTRYNINLFVVQLKDLLDALRFTLPVHLIGLSMGGPISGTFTARFPERVKSLTLIDPAGVRPVSLTPTLKAVKLPGIADVIFSLVGSETMIKSAAKDFFDPELIGIFTERYKLQMQYKGFKRAILSTIRNNMLGSFVESYRSVGKMDIPVSIFWGRDDKTVPLEHSHDLRALIPQAEFHLIENCGHIPHYEKPEEINPLLLQFLNKNE